MDDQLKTMIEKLQQTTGKNKETSSYIGFQTCQSKLSEAKCLVQEIREKDRMKFKSDGSVVPFLRNLNSLGNVEKVHVYKTQISAQYNVKIKGDKLICDIVGICKLPGGEVVFADYTKHYYRVKLLNKTYHVTGQCDIPGHPQHLCHITGKYVAVAISNTLAERYEVHQLTVTGGKLKAVRKFITDHESCSIAYHQGQLFVSSSKAIYMYTIKGQFVKKIYESLGLKVDTCAVSIDGENIYVTHEAKLITLDKAGQVISTLEDAGLQETNGLCVSPSGHVFVCGMASDTVLQEDQEGRQKLATLARKSGGVSQPQSLWFSEQTFTFLVGNSGSGTITVFKLC